MQASYAYYNTNPSLHYLGLAVDRIGSALLITD